MTNTQVLWVLQSDQRKLRGPFDTEVVLKMIREGQVSGEEKIARYPGGKWIPISKEPEFYDQLLGVLESDAEEAKKETVFRNNNNDDDETIIPDFLKSHSKVSFENSYDQKNSKDYIVEKKSEASVIELSNLKPIEQKTRLRFLLKPLAVLAGVFLLGLVLLFWPDSNSKGKIHLIAPKPGEETLSPEEIKTRTKLVLSDIQQDTVESYLQAQNKLVSLIEGAPRNLPGRALLCLVYKELWPYSYQDQDDQKVLIQFSQATKNLNLIGIHGNVCEAIKLMSLGRVKEARGVVDNMMDNPDDISFLSVVYVIKAELLSFDRDLPNAIAFYSQAMEKGKDWLKPRISLGFLQLKNKQYAEAMRNFQDALKLNPNHKSAKLGLGFVLHKGYKKDDEAFEWLKNALDMSARAPRDIEGEGFFILATLEG